MRGRLQPTRLKNIVEMRRGTRILMEARSGGAAPSALVAG